MSVVQDKYVVDVHGKTTAAAVPIERYRQLMEYLCDLVIVAERRAEKTISLEELKRWLKKDGLL